MHRLFQRAIPLTRGRLMAVAAAAASLSPVFLVCDEKQKHDRFQRRFSDHYKLVEKAPLGFGACSAVLAAVHRETGEMVAVKRISQQTATAEEVTSEVAVMRLAGEHRNVLQLQDAFWDESYWYLVMEEAKGGELFDRLVNQGLLTERDTAAVIHDLTNAVAFLHMNGIVHGDIKPENVLLASPDSIDVRLGDFGSAGETDGTGAVRHGTNGLTIAYSPPEVLACNGRGGVTEKADVWSLGVILYILMAGRHPFDRDMDADEKEIAQRICSGAVSFEDPIWKPYPLAVDLLRRMLSKDPAERPTAEEVLQHKWFSAGPLQISGAEALSKDAFHRFCAGRRRLKAVLLAVMCGITASPAPEEAQASNVSPSAALKHRRSSNSSSSANSSNVEDSESAADSSRFGGAGLLRLTSKNRRMIGSRAVACRRIDREGKGYISESDLMHVLRQLGEDASEADVQAMMGGGRGVPGGGPRSAISYEEMARLIPPLCPARIFEPGQLIYSEGETDPTLYLLKRGAVEFSLAAPKGGRIVLQKLGEGASFGEVELLGADGATLPRVCSCRCAEAFMGSPVQRCELLAVTKDLFSLLTDVLQGVEAKVIDQCDVRLTQVSSELLARGFNGSIVQSNAAGAALWPLQVESDEKQQLQQQQQQQQQLTTGASEREAAASGKMLTRRNSVLAALLAAAVPREALPAAALLASEAASAAAAAAAAASGSNAAPLSGKWSEAAAVAANARASKQEEESAAAAEGRPSSVLVVLNGSVMATYGQKTLVHRDMRPGEWCYCGAGCERLVGGDMVARFVVSASPDTKVLLVPLASFEKALEAPNMTALLPALLGR